MPRKGPTEQDVLRIVMDRGNDGILQSELWREMKADSREGSRAILRLERKRLIERKRELHSGRWTYRVFARRKYSSIKRKRLIERKRELHSGRWTYRVFARRKYSSINSIMDVPCSFCDIEARCAPAAAVNAARCDRMNTWILASVSGSSPGR